jgi:hypothetical protein
LKTSTQEDLIIGVNAECGLYTAVGAKGGGSGSTTSSTATGVVTLSVYLDPGPVSSTTGLPTSGLVPTSSVNDSSANANLNESFGYPPLPADANGPVVYCGRAVNLSTANLGLNEMISLFENTRSANSFQWYSLDVGNGTHTVDVYATLEADTASSGTNGGSGSTTIGPGTTPAASAMIGQRTLIIYPDHLGNTASF